MAYDAEAKGLAIRVLPSGKRTFFWAGKDGYRKALGEFPAISLADARTAALALSAEAPQKALMKVKNDFTLEEAFADALASSNRCDRSKVDWDRAVEAFLKWKKKSFPSVKCWKDLPRVVVKAYLATRQHVSDTRRRLDLQPVIQTARFMLREYDLPNLCDGLGIGCKLERSPRPVYVKDVLSFLDHLKTHAPHLEAGAALQALAGLQLQEALRLTWDKVDLKRGLVEISGEVKNEYRNRVIPVCGRVLEALRDGKERHDVKDTPDKAHVVLSTEGYAFDGTSWLNYSKLLTRVMRGNSPMKKTKKGITPTLKPHVTVWNTKIEWQPKDLRNCLPTLAATEGVLNVAWEQYIGHAAKGVTQRHYIPRIGSATEGEKDALERNMAVFRRQVVAVVEKAIADATQ